MGLSKLVNKGNGKVVIVHQLNPDGTAYAENVTIEVQEGVDPSRIDYLIRQDGQIGTVSYSFTPFATQPEGLKFPEA